MTVNNQNNCWGKKWKLPIRCKWELKMHPFSSNCFPPKLEWIELSAQQGGQDRSLAKPNLAIQPSQLPAKFLLLLQNTPGFCHLRSSSIADIEYIGETNNLS